MATQYYGSYAKNVGFQKTVTSENAQRCLNCAQYIGKIVNDVETAILIGAYRFPNNAAINELDKVAKAASMSVPSLDTVRFGRWTD
jgi:hypothetical protein